MSVQLLIDRALSQTGSDNFLFASALAARDVWTHVHLSQQHCTDPAKQQIQGAGTYKVGCVLRGQSRQGKASDVGGSALDTDYFGITAGLFCDGVLLPGSEVNVTVTTSLQTTAGAVSPPWAVAVDDEAAHVLDVRFKVTFVPNTRPASVYDRNLIAADTFGACWFRVEKTS